MGGTGGSDVRRFTVALAVSLLVLPLAVHGTSRPEGWDDETHSRDAAADLRRVFAADRVNRLDIEITASDWQAAMATMAGAFGAQRAQGGGQGGGGAALPAPSPEAIAGCAGRVVGEARAVGPVTGERCVQAAPTTLACIVQPAGVGQGGGNPPPGAAGPCGRPWCQRC